MLLIEIEEYLISLPLAIGEGIYKDEILLGKKIEFFKYCPRGIIAADVNYFPVKIPVAVKKSLINGSTDTPSERP